MNFSYDQFTTLSKYFSNISQAFFLGAVAGQTLSFSLTVSVRILLSIFWFSMSLLFLYLSLVCSKEKEQ